MTMFASPTTFARYGPAAVPQDWEHLLSAPAQVGRLYLTWWYQQLAAGFATFGALGRCHDWHDAARVQVEFVRGSMIRADGVWREAWSYASPAGADRPVAAADAMPAPDIRPRADDLKAIKGIGPGLERKLNDLGIVRFEQIAALTPAAVADLDEQLDFRGRIEREGWIEQARALAAETTDGNGNGNGKPAA